MSKNQEDYAQTVEALLSRHGVSVQSKQELYKELRGWFKLFQFIIFSIYKDRDDWKWLYKDCRKDLKSLLENNTFEQLYRSMVQRYDDEKQRYDELKIKYDALVAEFEDTKAKDIPWSAEEVSAEIERLCEFVSEI